MMRDLTVMRADLTPEQVEIVAEVADMLSATGVSLAGFPFHNYDEVIGARTAMRSVVKILTVRYGEAFRVAHERWNKEAE